MRLVWAAGYPTEINYLIPCLHINGVPRSSRSAARCEGNGFANVRLEARPEDVKRAGEWNWNRNPFVGTRELQGLIVLMGLINNWDLKDANNVILDIPARGSGAKESLYAISDLGATFGKIGRVPFFWRITRSRNKPRDFAESRFIDKVKGNRVAFRYGGKNRGLFSNISVDSARWIGSILSRLSDQQIGNAFRAANYSPSDVALLTRTVRERINELVNVRPRGEGPR